MLRATLSPSFAAVSGASAAAIASRCCGGASALSSSSSPCCSSSSSTDNNNQKTTTSSRRSNVTVDNNDDPILQLHKQPALQQQRSGSSSRALTDTLGRFHNYLRISLTERCNLRCLYCMPETGLPTLTEKSKLLTTEEFVRITKLFVSLGVDKVRLTGGEPLIHPGCVDVCSGIRDCGVKTIGITTNGILLHRHMIAMKQAGLTNINISLDTLQEDRFMMITRRKGFGRVMDTLRMAENLAFKAVKINCVVMRGVNDDEVGEFAKLTKDRNIELRFIEYMPFDDNKWERKKMVPFMETMDRVEAACGAGKLVAVPPKPGDTAKVFSLPGYKGRVGFITSMTTQFCGTCNRLRLTADGHLKVCLFDSNEVSLLQPMREGASDAELTEVIASAVKAKQPALGGKANAEEIASSSNRHMSSIGG